MNQYKSKILQSAIVGGAGRMMPPGAIKPPHGFGFVLLYVPMEKLESQTPVDIQADLELPWSGPNGAPYYFEGNEHLKPA